VVGTVISPAVMLSPNARKVVRGSGGGATLTLKVQLAVNPRASLALHAMRVVPIGKAVPAGEHETVTGSTPPAVVGDGTWIATGAPVEDWPSTSAGHCIVNG